MSVVSLRRIGVLIREQQHILLARWRHQVRRLPSAKDLDVPSLNDHMPVLIDELATALENEPDDSTESMLLHGSPPTHGRQRLQDGFNVEEVVAEYNVLRSCIHDIAEEHGLIIHGSDLRVINRIIDEAIALAVQTYATRLSLEIKKHQDQHIAFVANDLRTPLQAISLTAHIIERMFQSGSRDVESQQLIKLLRRNIQQLETSVIDVIKTTDAEPPENLIETIERRTIDLWPLVESVLSELQPVIAASSVEISNKIPFDMQAWADAGLLRRALENIFTTAIDSTPHSHIRIEGSELEAGEMRCTIAYDGLCLDSAEINARCENISSDVAADAPATSVRLTVTRQIIEAHQGKFSINQDATNGVNVEFILPAG